MGNIIWVASYPRSGNTWMRVFLHALLVGSRDSDTLPNLEGFCPNEANRRFYEKVLGKPVDSASLGELALARLDAQKQIAASRPGVCLAKTHHRAGLHLGMPTVNLSVTGGAICIVRNPLDVAVSWQRFLSISLVEVADLMKLGSDHVFRAPGASYYHMSSWAENVRSWTQSGHRNVLVVRYEDMVGEPETTFRGVAEFLGVDLPEGRLNDILGFTGFSELQRRESSRPLGEHGFLNQSYFREGRSGAWQKTVPPAIARTIVEGSEDVLERFGYREEIDAYLSDS